MSVSKHCLNFIRKNSASSACFTPTANVISCDRKYGSAQLKLKKIPEKRPDWNRAVSEAEKVVGYTTSFMGLRWLLSDEVANVAMHMRKLVGSNHPLLKAAKGLIFNGKNNMQAWGLIVLLLSKALGYTPAILDISEEDKTAGFLQTQRSLAEVTEMIRTSHLIHKGLMNLHQDQSDGDMIYGNKMALLSGDYLLSHSCIELANLRNQELVELMSSAVRDLSEAEFFGPRDLQNHPLPSPPKKEDSLFHLPEDPLEPLKIEEALGNGEAEWTLRNVLESGNLLGKSCQGTLKLAGHSANIQREAFRFGRHFALAWQACLDRQPFTSEATGQFSLVSAPILLSLQYNDALYQEIEKGFESINDVDYGEIRKMVMSGPGVEMTRKLQRKHSDIALQFLDKLPSSDARNAMSTIMAAMD